MKKVNVKKVSVFRNSQPRSVVEGARELAPRLSMRGGASGGDKMMRHFSAPPDVGLELEPMLEVELEVEGALPTTNYANFWLGDQLMLGTMLDEKGQKMTGFVRRPVPEGARIRVELPDGTEQTFDVQVEQSPEDS